jgi:hypothetical protein
MTNNPEDNLEDKRNWKKDDFVIKKITHKDLIELFTEEQRNRIYGVNDYEVNKYASDIWKSIIKDPVDLTNLLDAFRYHYSSGTNVWSD